MLRKRRYSVRGAIFDELSLMNPSHTISTMMLMLRWIYISKQSNNKSVFLKNVTSFHYLLLLQTLNLISFCCLFVIQSDEEKPFICKIVEIFEGTDGEMYFTAQWFYRAYDTVSIKNLFSLELYYYSICWFFLSFS